MPIAHNNVKKYSLLNIEACLQQEQLIIDSTSDPEATWNQKPRHTVSDREGVTPSVAILRLRTECVVC